MGLTSLQKRLPQQNPSPPLLCEEQRGAPSTNPEVPSLDGESAGVLMVDFPGSGTVRNKFVLFISYFVCGILL